MNRNKDQFNNKIQVETPLRNQPIQFELIINSINHEKLKKKKIYSINEKFQTEAMPPLIVIHDDLNGYEYEIS
jgi:hypothetical protein